MASKRNKEPFIPSYPNFNSDNFFPSILALSTSFGAFFLFEPLLSYSTENPQNPIINLLIQLLLYILVPITFFLGMGLLFLRAVVPSNSPRDEIYAVRINHLTKFTVAMALTSLLAGLAIGVYVVRPDAVESWWVGW